MLGSTGLPELAIVLVILVSWLVPLAAGIWALITLQRLTVGQHHIRMQLEAIERTLTSGLPRGQYCGHPEPPSLDTCVAV